MYVERIVDVELAERLAATGAVVIEGPRACGKTETARQIAASEVLLDVDADARVLAGIAPSQVLAGAAPRLIDEWQLEPSIWNHVRRAIDDRNAPGQFILTGSAVPADDITRHTGAGRLTRLRMRPLSLFETGHASGAISMKALLEGVAPNAPEARISIASLAELICEGGWPSHLNRSAKQVLRANRDYLNEVRRMDISRVSGKSRDPVKVEKLLHSLARNVATPVTMSTLAKDVRGGGAIMKADTAAEYLEALEQLMIVENQLAWAPHLRSRSVARTTPVRHFTDPSLAAAALRASPDRLRQDAKTLGFLFESLVIRDLRVYAQAADAEVYHYRDKDGLEADAIVQAMDGRWAAFEIKLGGKRVDEGARNLLKLAKRVDQELCGAPSMLAVIVPSGYGYMRPDGVGIIPIGALGP